MQIPHQALQRAVVIAQPVQPGANWVNLGLILPGAEPGGRLEPAGKWNALFTHRVRIAAAGEVDADVQGWLADAYRAAA